MDRQVEHGRVAGSPRHLQLGADRPDVLRPEKRLGADQFAFVPAFTRAIGGMTSMGSRIVILLCCKEASGCTC